jgi:RNA polymerase primary sigma factor
MLKLEKLKTSLAESLEREPTVVEWSRLVGVSPRELHNRLRKGKECRDKMVHANMRLVVSVAKKYLGRGMALEDLITVCLRISIFIDSPSLVTSSAALQYSVI